MEQPTLVVKKYGNRRLYDTEASCYITLDDLARVVRAGRDVKVVDAKSGANLTKAVLLQIIADQEKDLDILPLTFLKRMIQLGDSQLRDALHRYLSVTLDTFMNAQQEFEKRYRKMAGNLLNPLAWMMPDGEPFPAWTVPGAPDAPPPPGAAEAQADDAPAPSAAPAPEQTVQASAPAGDDSHSHNGDPEDDPTQREIRTLRDQVSKIQDALSKLAQ